MAMLALVALTDTPEPPFTFQFGGETFTCRSPNDMDVRRLNQMLTDAQRDPSTQLHWMLGDEQWEKLESIEQTFSMRHLVAVTDGWLAHHGLNLGKSGGSSKPSTSIQFR